MSFYRGFYVNSRVILLSKLDTKIAFSSFRSTNHRQVLFWEGQQATKIDPNFWVASSARSLARQGHWRDQLGRQADAQMPLLQNLIPKLGICTLLLPKSPCERPQQSAPRMKQMEEELRPSAAWQQQKPLLPGEWYHCVCVCTHQRALKLCFNFQSSSTAKHRYALVSPMTGCILLGAVKIDGWFTYGIRRAYKNIVRVERLKIWLILFS